MKKKSLLLKNLLYLIETIRAGKISKAAELIGAKQSNVSSIIKELEDGLGVKLLIRHKNGVTPTEAGQRVFDLSLDLERILYVIKNYSTYAHEVSGEIRLWTTEGLMVGVLARHIADFYKTNPNVHINVKCSNDTPSIMLREADVAIVYEEPKASDTVIINKQTIKFALFASKKYINTYGRPKDLDDLLENHTICDRYNFKDVWEEWDQMIGKTKNVASTTNSSSVLMQMTKEGIGIGLHPISVGAIEPDLVMLDNIDLGLDHPFWIICHKDTKDVPKIHALIEYIKSATKSIR